METKVYVVDLSDFWYEDSPKNWNDEDFKAEAEKQKSVFTLEEFQKAFNEEEVNTTTDLIRIITE